MRRIINLIVPSKCSICGDIPGQSNSTEICEKCWSDVKRIPEQSCRRCENPLPSRIIADESEDLVCGQCKKHSKSVDVLSSYGIYEGVLKEAIHLFKYRRNIYTGERLAGFAVEAFKKKFSSNVFDLIIPVPLHQSRLRWREFNQAMIISKDIGKCFDIPVSYNLLIRKKRTESQTKLTIEERMINMKDAFEVNSRSQKKLSSIFRKPGFKKEAISETSLSGKRILLVDDVLTTGITTDECARVLKDNDADYVGVVTVAKAGY